MLISPANKVMLNLIEKYLERPMEREGDVDSRRGMYWTQEAQISTHAWWGTDVCVYECVSVQRVCVCSIPWGSQPCAGWPVLCSRRRGPWWRCRTDPRSERRPGGPGLSDASTASAHARRQHKVYLTYYSNINRTGKGVVCTNIMKKQIMNQ